MYLFKGMLLIAHKLITSSGRKINILDLWPDTKDHMICLMVGLMIGFWNAFLNKVGWKIFAWYLFKSCEKWYHKVVDALGFGLLTYVGIACFYTLMHSHDSEPVVKTKPIEQSVSAGELVVREEIVYLKGSETSYTGKAFEIYQNDQKKFEANFKYGKKHGLETSWYKNGNKQEEAFWKNGEMNGNSVTWHENGQKKNYGLMKSGESVGLWKMYYENGQIKAKGNLTNNKQNGLWLGWYESGSKKFERIYKNGKRDGFGVAWHENGEKLWDGNFMDDKPVKKSLKFWNSKGETVDSLEEAIAK